MADYNQGFYQPDHSYDPNQGAYGQGYQTAEYESQYTLEGYDQTAGGYGDMGQMGSQPSPEIYGQGTGFEEERPLLEGRNALQELCLLHYLLCLAFFLPEQNLG